MATAIAQTKPVQPFVKWAGGKRQLLSEISARLPKVYKNYFEPFVGGGALFFNLAPQNATINDINSALINAYQQIRDNPASVIAALEKVDAAHENSTDPKAYYYDMREQYNLRLSTKTYDAQTAALLIFVNKHCFNGLYRVNAKGQFNVPFNGSVRNSFSEENIYASSRLLENTNIISGDFEAACAGAEAGDFIFFDSPYAPLNPTSFEAYTKEGFSKEEHIRLANLFNRLSEAGCYCMLTNHDTPFIRELYAAYTIETISVHRFINSDATNRKGVELIIKNY